MTSAHYTIVEHDGGWAYKLGDVFSETFPTRQDAHDAAEAAAREQRAPDEDTDIEYQDEKGGWKAEHSSGGDRPTTDVED